MFLLTKSLTLISLLQSPSIKVLFNSIIFILLVGNGCYPNKDCKITIFFPHSIAWIVSFYVVRHKITIVRYGSLQLRSFFCAYYLHSFTHLLVNGRLIAGLISFADWKWKCLQKQMGCDKTLYWLSYTYKKMIFCRQEVKSLLTGN